MPAITIKVFEGELTWGQAAELVDDVTEAVVPFVGEAARSDVSLLVEVRSGSRGIGGKALGHKGVRQIQQSAAADQQPDARRAAHRTPEV